MVAYIDFIEQHLELGIDYGAVGGLEFKTTIINLGDGREQRNCDWWFPLGRWQLGERTLISSDSKGINQIEYLKQFHADRKGSKQGFRYKDWSDYKASESLAITDGIEQVWQLYKSYSLEEVTTYRPIIKPVEGTVKVFLEGEEINYALINYETGRLSFSAPPPINQLLSIECEFDTPVCFENDSISWDLLGYQNEEALYKLGSVFVKELRYPLSQNWGFLSPLKKISKPLNLGIILNSSEKIEFNTSNNTLSSGYVRKDSNWNNPRTTITLPNKTWNNAEIETILSYFWNCKGRLQLFNLLLNKKNYLCRFNQDQLNIKFELQQGNDSLFSISGLSFLNLTNLNYDVLFADVPLIYTANSVVNLAGLVLSQFDGAGVANLDLELQFDFGVNQVLDLTTDENGFFFGTFQTSPNLLHPDSGKLILSSLQTEFIFQEFDITTSPESIPFSLKVPNEIFSGTTIIISGVAPPGTNVNLVCSELSFDTNITADAAGQWSYSLTIDSNFSTSEVTFNLHHYDFDSLNQTTTITQLGFNPVLGLQQFQFN